MDGPLDAASDAAALAELGRRLVARRLRLDRTQGWLAREAGVSKRTVERLEAGGSAQLTSLVRVLRALGLLGQLELLVPDPGTSPLEELRRERQRRRRASGRDDRDAGGAEPWTWGEPDPDGGDA